MQAICTLNVDMFVFSSVYVSGVQKKRTGVHKKWTPRPKKRCLGTVVFCFLSRPSWLRSIREKYELEENKRHNLERVSLENHRNERKKK